MDDFKWEQVESDDPEKVTYLIRLPAELCNPVFLEILKQETARRYVYEMKKILENGVKND